MLTEITATLSRDEVTVRRHRPHYGTECWMAIEASGVEFSIFGTPEQIDAFIDKIASMKGQVVASTEALQEAQ